MKLFNFMLCSMLYLCVYAQSQVKTKHSLEEEIHRAFHAYIKGINQDDWQDTFRNMLVGDIEGMIAEHQGFRDAFANYKATIMHLVVEGNYAMAWLNVEAKHVGVYNGIYSGRESQYIKPTNKNLSWEEVWYFDYADGKLAPTTFKLMGQDLKRLQQLGVTAIPNPEK